VGLLKPRAPQPPETWTILAASLGAPSWYAKYRHFAKHMAQFSSLAEYHAKLAEGGARNNTQISTFGMGHLLVQVFSCPQEQSWLIQDYESSVAKTGAIQLWPIRKRIWPRGPRLPVFPSAAVFDDEQADVFADAFNDRLEGLTLPPHFGGRLG
jgi:hypothetical protein